jgi:hypothetical protein
MAAKRFIRADARGQYPKIISAALMAGVFEMYMNYGRDKHNASRI